MAALSMLSAQAYDPLMALPQQTTRPSVMPNILNSNGGGVNK
jgi:hypothetical protein